MGTLIGHVAPGFGFLIIGLWHLFNNIKLHGTNPKSFRSSAWFPSSRIRYLELYSIMAGCAASISMELFIGPKHHQPFDPDGTIPSNHLHNFEHSNISFLFLVYAVFSILLDRLSLPEKHGLTHLLGSAAFGHMLLTFHLHSADHMGVEGQYHWLLQIVILITFVTALLGICWPESFVNSFVRSVSIVFQGVWFMVTGFMLWTPSLIPKDCFMNLEEGHKVVRCNGGEALERAKSLVNIEFSWFLVVVIVFAMTLYLVMIGKLYREQDEYQSLTGFVLRGDDDEEDDGNDDVEAQKKWNSSSDVVGTKSFLQMGKANFGAMDIER